MVTISSILLVISVVFFTSLERIYIRNLITPFTVTAWPLALISLTTNIFAVKIGFLPITIRTNLFLLLNIVILWCVSFLMNFQKPTLSISKRKYDEIFHEFKNYLPSLYIIAWIIVFYVVYHILGILKQEGFAFFATEEYEEQIVIGLVAHLIQVAKVIFILLMLIQWNKRKSFLYYLTLSFLALIIIALRVKYHFVWVILIVFFIRNLNKPINVQIKTIFKIVLAVSVIFLVNYLIMFIAFTSFSIYNQSMWNFIIGHFFNYIMSGPMILDKWLNLAYSKQWWSLFVVPINFYNLVIGSPERLNAVNFVSPGFVRVSPLYASNVGTSYGVFYLIGGFPLTILMTTILGTVSYRLYKKIFVSPNPINLFLTSVFLVMGFLSFFVQFFTLLSLYEMTLIFLIFILIFKFFNHLTPVRNIV